MGLPIFGTSDFANATWVAEKNTRGTWNLVQTCLITLGLCVYSAVHLNCFQQGCSYWMKVVVRGKWLLVALLAPEFIVFNAWSQRRQALRITRIMNRRSGQEEPKSWMRLFWQCIRMRSILKDEEKGKKKGKVEQLPESKRIGTTSEKKPGQKGVGDVHEIKPVQGHNRRKDTFVSTKSIVMKGNVPELYTLTHGFAIVMGGLVVDMSRDPERTWPASCNTLTITPACFEELFERPGFCDIDLTFITLERIEARQKTDNLAKLLVIIQALWFCINFVVRIVQELPVSLLELNTFAHALCALFIYILWWHKPGDIEEPFVLRTEKSEALRDLCAAQWTSGATGKLYEGQLVHAITDQSKSATQWTPMFLHSGSEFVMNLARGRHGVTLCPGSGEDWYLFDYSNRWFFFPHLPNTSFFNLRTLDSHSLEPTVIKAKELVPSTPYRLATQFNSLQIEDTTLKRWRRTFNREDLTRNYTVWLRDRQPNFAWPRGLDDSQDGARIAEELLKSLFMFLLTSLCYGGLHVLAWDSGTVGRTHLTQTLWKLSCLLLMSIGPFAYAVWLGLKLWRGADAHLRLNQGTSVVFGVIGVVAFFAYVISRVYLLVEILLVVPFVDPKVYQEVELSVYWPHF